MFSTMHFIFRYIPYRVNVKKHYCAQYGGAIEASYFLKQMSCMRTGLVYYGEMSPIFVSVLERFPTKVLH